MNKINQKIAILTQDPEIQMCVNGRDLRQIQGREAGKSEARFPNLLDTSIMAIISAGLDQANKNYDKKNIQFCPFGTFCRSGACGVSDPPRRICDREYSA